MMDPLALAPLMSDEARAELAASVEGERYDRAREELLEAFTRDRARR